MPAAISGLSSPLSPRARSLYADARASSSAPRHRRERSLSSPLVIQIASVTAMKMNQGRLLERNLCTAMLGCGEDG